jgi:clan AA aspartic protease (TIGR02281 family)
VGLETLKALILIASFFIFGSVPAAAETIELKNGKRITGEIIRETPDAVVVSRESGAFVHSISRDRIAGIRSSTPDELAERAVPAVNAGKASKGTSREEAEKERTEAVRKYRLERYEKEVLAAKKARGRIRIKFTDNRFGVVTALLNGKVKAKLLADTGASMVVISRDVATRLGITDTGKEGKISVVLADGSVTTAVPITLDSVKVGASELKNVRAAISESAPGSGLDGLLGMTFLGHFHVKMDAKENSLVLEKY